MALYTVGFLGAGRIGAPMVERLLAAGHRVLLHVRRPGVRTRLGALGADLVGDPVDLATADVVVSCLFDDTQLLAVAPPIVAALGVDAAFVSHTTGSPAVLDQLASGGTTVVDAPFSGDADAVSAGRLTVFLGRHRRGPRRAERLRGHDRGHGPRGSALRVELLNNLLFAGISQLTVRAAEAGRALGIADDDLLAALAVASGGSTAAHYIRDRGGPAAFAAAVAPVLRKDVDAAGTLAAALDIDLAGLLAAATDGPIDLHPIARTPEETS